MAARIDKIVISELAATDLIVNEGIVVYPLEIFPIWKNIHRYFKT